LSVEHNDAEGQKRRGVPLISCETVVASALVVVLRDSQSVEAVLCGATGGTSMTLICRKAEVASGLAEVLRCSLAPGKALREHGLCVSMTLVGCELVVANDHGAVTRHSLALGVRNRRGILHLDAALVGCEAEVVNGLGIVSREALCLCVAYGEAMLCLSVALIGCEAVVVNSLGLILRRALTPIVLMPKRKLRLSVALVGCEAEVVNSFAVVSPGSSSNSATCARITPSKRVACSLFLTPLTRKSCLMMHFDAAFETERCTSSEVCAKNVTDQRRVHFAPACAAALFSSSRKGVSSAAFFLFLTHRKQIAQLYHLRTVRTDS